MAAAGPPLQPLSASQQSSLSLCSAEFAAAQAALERLGEARAGRDKAWTALIRLLESNASAAATSVTIAAASAGGVAGKKG
jgi:hypothetical protein